MMPCKKCIDVPVVLWVMMVVMKSSAANRKELL